MRLLQSDQDLTSFFSQLVTDNGKGSTERPLDKNDIRVTIENSHAKTNKMSDDSEIEHKRNHEMSSKRSKGKGKRSLSIGNEKGAKRRCQDVDKRETPSDKTDRSNAKPYGCQLCETAFNNVSSRNGHYSGKHKVQDEKLLFFPNGTGLVESSLEHQISLKPDWFKAAIRSKRRTTVCKLCVVDLDTDDHLNLHYKDIHKVTRMSVLSELIRLKNTDIKKVAVTHKCDFCTVPFDDAQDLESHMKSAHDADFKRCDYCNIRVQIDVYNAHILKKHADMIGKRVEAKRIEVEVPHRKRKQSKCEKKVKAKKVETPKRDVENKDKVRKTKEPKAADCRSSLVPAIKKSALTMYLCKVCKLATASYDNAVAHAQDHILNLPTKTNHCEICKLNFATDFGRHRKLHLIDDDLDAKSFRLFSYDYRLLMSHKWFDMFVNASKAMANKVRSSSIYFPSRCIRLKLENDIKDATERFTLFMCVTCNKYVDPPSIELHVEQQGDCSNQLSCYLCYQCQRQFFTQKARDQHSLTHEIPDADKKYRTVLFNDQKDLICNRKLLQAGMNIVLTNKESVNENVTRNSESSSNISNIITVVHEGLYNVKTFENNVLNELYAPVNDNDVVADVYDCKCGLSFDRLEFLCKHWKICSPALKIVTETCKCGLVFDKANYDYHCKVHSNGFTTFSVKEVSVRVKKSIDIRHINYEFRNTTEMNASEIIYNGMEGDNIIREEEVNKEHQGKSLQSLQVVNIVNVEEIVGNNLLKERQTLLNHAHQPINMENSHQSRNEHDSAKYIGETQADNEFEADKAFISNDISYIVSQTEVENQVPMDLTDTSISIKNDDVPDKGNILCNNNTDENEPMVDDSMGTDLKQVTYQDKDLLISNTKEQDSVENSEAEKYSVSPSLDENVLHNTDSVNEGSSNIIEDKPANTDITKENIKHDETVSDTRELKAKEGNIEFVDKQNKKFEQNDNESIHPSIDKVNENREHKATEIQCEDSNQVKENVYSEEDLLEGPDDPHVVDDSLLTDDEHP